MGFQKKGKKGKKTTAYPDAEILLNGRYVLQGNRLFDTDKPEEEALMYEIPANRQMLFENIVNYDLNESYCLSEVAGEYFLWGVLDTAFLVSFNKSEANPMAYAGFNIKNNASSLEFTSTEGSSSLRFLPLGQEEWVFSDDKGYFTSTLGAASRVGFRNGMKAFPLEQFDVNNNRPDLLFKNFSVADEKLLQSYEAAYKKRLEKMKLLEELLAQKQGLPQVSIVNKDSLQRTLGSVTFANQIELKIHASDAQELLDRVDVWVNGVAVFGKSGYDLKKLQTKNADISKNIKLKPGRNKIQVSVTNQLGVKSVNEDFIMTKQSNVKDKSNLYIIGIGASCFRR